MRWKGESFSYRGYPRVAAAFYDPRRPGYDAKANADAAVRVLQILRAHLG